MAIILALNVIRSMDLSRAIILTDSLNCIRKFRKINSMTLSNFSDLKNPLEQDVWQHIARYSCDLDIQMHHVSDHTNQRDLPFTLNDKDDSLAKKATSLTQFGPVNESTLSDASILDEHIVLPSLD